MPKVTFRTDACKGCGLCVIACPKKIIALSAETLNKKGFKPAVVTDESSCTGCAMCATMCPDLIITVYK